MDGYFDQDGHPQVIIKLEGLTKEVISVNCLIDTGFDGYLTLTQATGIRLGLPLLGTTYVELADGSKRSELLYLCKVTFGEEEKMVPVALSNSSTALLGTKLLIGKRLLMNFKNRTVKIVTLTTKSISETSKQFKLLRKQATK